MINILVEGEVHILIRTKGPEPAAANNTLWNCVASISSPPRTISISPPFAFDNENLLDRKSLRSY